MGVVHHTAPLSTLILLIALTVPFLISAQASIDWHACPTVPSGSYHTQLISGTNSTVTPNESVDFELTGDLYDTITNGMYQLRLTTTTTTTVAAEVGGGGGGGGAEIVIIDDQFGTLDKILLTPSPIISGSNVIIKFHYTLPLSERFSTVMAITSNQPIQLELNMYSQQSTPITCVDLQLKLDVPGSTPSGDEPKNTSKVLGYGCALISVLFFGTNFLPVKAFETGDGVFFQWCLCIGIWLCGLIVQFIRGSVFEPFAMIGGLMWAIGNCLTVPIIGMIGLGVGMCLWGTAGLIMGWAAGKFGFGIAFALDKQTIDHEAMNYIGLLLCVGSMGIMFFVKSVKEEQAAAAAKQPTVFEPFLTSGVPAEDDPESMSIALRRKSNAVNHVPYDSSSPILAPSASPELMSSATDLAWHQRLPPRSRRLLGISLSIFAGCCYGLNFTPPQYLIDSGKGSSSHGIDYVFSHFTGILTTSTVYMIAYCIYSRNSPWVSPKIVLPGIASGIGWAIAQISWFIANDQIGFVGSFPLVSCGPGIVATLCAIIFYKEIQGRKNYLMLLLATAIIFTGCILIALSLPAQS